MFLSCRTRRILCNLLFLIILGLINLTASASLRRDTRYRGRRAYYRSLCPDIPPIVNGRRWLESGGAKARFSCDEGFMLKGNAVTYCRRGTWTHPPALCISYSATREEIANVEAMREPQQPQWIGPYQKTVRSNSPYKQQHWMNESDTTCLKGGSQTSRPPAIEDGFYQYSLNAKQAQLWVTYKCNEGYILSGNDTLFCRNFNWIGHRPRCTLPDPCSINNGGCEHLCTSSQNGVTNQAMCTCRTGYVLASDGKRCEDVDECKSRATNLCDHTCINTPGDYRCICDEGYKLLDNYRCEACRKNTYKRDVSNDCELCPSNSHTNGVAKTSSSDCICDDGFKGDPGRGIACVDINECDYNNFGCSDKCWNVDGTAYCTCPLGFYLGDDEKTCKDVNECNQSNGGCEQKCVNTEGSYYCTCDPGFTRNPKTRECEDIDECRIDNGGCQHICMNWHGTHICKCYDFFHIAEDGRSCREITCRALEVPKFGKMMCSSDNVTSSGDYRVGVSCEIFCEKGYRRKGGTARICSDDGTWSGRKTRCIPQECPKLSRPENGDVHPRECYEGGIHVDQICEFSCKPNFELRGEPIRKCNRRRKWKPRGNTPKCVAISNDPFISCPPDVTVELPLNSSAVKIKDLPQPTTNLDKIELSPSWAENSAVFPLGPTQLEWAAFSRDRLQKKTCTMTIFVVDKQPPTLVQPCPASFDVEAVDGWVNVWWDEPTFQDNVAIYGVQKTHIPGSNFTKGRNKIKYSANDTSGNVAGCDFVVNVKSPECEPATGPVNGNANCMNWIYGTFCEPTCEIGFTRYALAGHNTYMCDAQTAEWYPSRFIPDCTPFQAYVPGKDCPNGYELRTVDNKCVACPRGMYFAAHITSCMPCETGYYQHKFGQSECIKCPPGKLTEKPGSVGIEECVELDQLPGNDILI